MFLSLERKYVFNSTVAHIADVANRGGYKGGGGGTFAPLTDSGRGVPFRSLLIVPNFLRTRSERSFFSERWDRS